MKVRVIAKKYYYEDRTYQQGSVFDWDIKKHKKLSLAVKEVKDDVEVGDPEPKKQPEPVTLNEIAKGQKPKVSEPSKNK